MPDARPADGSFWHGIATLNDWPVAKAAYAYAAHGLAVFPVWWVEQDPAGEEGSEGGEPGPWVCACKLGAECSEPGKHPLVTWSKEGGPDPAEVQRWWGRWPRANIGLNLGKCAPALVVLDLDQREEEGPEGFSVLDGADVLEAWGVDNQVWPLPAGPRAITGGGGAHWLFLDPGGARNAVGWLPQVDVKAAGGYVLLSPSRHVSGRLYQWVTTGAPGVGKEGGPGPTPERLAASLRAGSGGGKEGQYSGGRGVGPAYDYQQAKQEGPDAGHRDEFFNAYAHEMRRNGVGKYEAEQELRAVWEKTVQPAGDQFTWEAARRKADYVWASVEVEEDKRPEVAPVLAAWARKQDRHLSAVDGNAVREIALTPEQRPPEEVVVSLTDARLHGQELLLSEHSASMIYVRLNSHLHKFTPGGKMPTWHAWDGNIWALDMGGAQARSVGMDRVRAWFAQEALKQAGALDEPQQRAWVRFQERLSQSAGVTAVIALAKDRTEMRVESAEMWDPDPDLWVLENGTVHLPTGQFGPSRPEHLNTRCCAAKWPASGLDTPDPEKWVEQLRWMTGLANGDRDEQEYEKLWRWCGYGVTGHVRENKALVMVGQGRNGKSIFTETMAAILGSYAVLADVRVFTGESSQHSTEVAALEGARFIYGAEVPTRINVDRFKVLTGEATLSARQMGENSRTFRMQGKLFLHGNAMPTVPASALQSDGYWRRLAPLLCERQVSEEEKDDTLKAQFWQERGQIVAWLVRGAMAWYRDGLTETWRGRLELAKYREDENPAAAFVSLYFKHPQETEERSWVPLSVLREMNDEYCREYGEKPCSTTILKANLRALGFGVDSDEVPRPRIKFDGPEKLKSARGLSCPPFLDEVWRVWKHL